jgi:hypothetical protein
MQEGTSNLFLLFFSWWYKYLPHRLYLAFSALSIMLSDLFSIKAIFRTLFAPWKRDIISYEGLTLQQKFSVWTLNMSSRFIGFLIKIFVLGVFIIFYLVAIIIFLGGFFLWIAFPLAILALIIIGFTNLDGGI